MSALRVAITCIVIAAPLRAQGSDSGRVTLHIPRSVGAFTFAGRHDYPDPALGVLVRYMRPDSLRVDVFAYPGPDFATRCVLACAQKVLDGEVSDFKTAFPEMIRQHYVDSIFALSDETLTPTASDHWQLGHHTVLRVVRNGAAERSDLYLYYIPGSRVKLRASYVADSVKVQAVAAFASRIVDAMVSEPPRTIAVAGDTVRNARQIGISVTMAEREPVMFHRVIDALVKLGFAIADSDVAAGRIVTAPSLAWPKGSENESWHGQASPGVVLHVSVQAKGDSSAVEIGGHSPTVANWKDASVADRLETMSVLLLADALRAGRR